MAGAALALMVVGAYLVAGVAIWLLLVSTLLDQISTRLDIIINATSGIASQVEPAPEVVNSIASDVGAIQSALHGLISQAPSGRRRSEVALVAPVIELDRPEPEPEYVFAWAQDHPDYHETAARARAARTHF